MEEKIFDDQVTKKVDPNFLYCIYYYVKHVVTRQI